MTKTINNIAPHVTKQPEPPSFSSLFTQITHTVDSDRVLSQAKCPQMPQNRLENGVRKFVTQKGLVSEMNHLIEPGKERISESISTNQQ